MHTYMHTCKHAYIHTYIHSYMHVTCIHAYMHTWHAYGHIRLLSLNLTHSLYILFFVCAAVNKRGLDESWNYGAADMSFSVNTPDISQEFEDVTQSHAAAVPHALSHAARLSTIPYSPLRRNSKRAKSVDRFREDEGSESGSGKKSVKSPMRETLDILMSMQKHNRHVEFLEEELVRIKQQQQHQQQQPVHLKAHLEEVLADLKEAVSVSQLVTFTFALGTNAIPEPEGKRGRGGDIEEGYTSVLEYQLEALLRKREGGMSWEISALQHKLEDVVAERSRQSEIEKEDEREIENARLQHRILKVEAERNRLVTQKQIQEERMQEMMLQLEATREGMSNSKHAEAKLVVLEDELSLQKESMLQQLEVAKEKEHTAHSERASAKVKVMAIEEERKQLEECLQETQRQHETAIMAIEEERKQVAKAQEVKMAEEIARCNKVLELVAERGSSHFLHHESGIGEHERQHKALACLSREYQQYACFFMWVCVDVSS